MRLFSLIGALFLSVSCTNAHMAAKPPASTQAGGYESILGEVREDEIRGRTRR